MYKKKSNRIVKKMKNKVENPKNNTDYLDNNSVDTNADCSDHIKNQYQLDLEKLEIELNKLDINYKGMLEREKQYLKNIASLEDEIGSLKSGDYGQKQLVKMQTNYEGMLVREKRYLSEIKKLQAQLETQQERLHKTYSYRLGYLLIHSTKSFKNFITLPLELRRLYRENKQRKQGGFELKIDKDDFRQSNPSFIHKPVISTKIKSNFSGVKIATIMDEFTSFCFAPEAETMQITPSNFREELLSFKPDFVFIESAWQGKDGLWKLKVSQQADELLSLIDFCRKNSIKTLFWNKEDPVHFGTFIDVAKLVDVVFTTDIDCIQKYKNIVLHDNVYLLPFAAQPKTHNPIELYDRFDKFNFAGSYYLKYPVRQRDFATLSEVARKVKGLDIYDRNFNNDHPHYQFPERYQSLILGSLAPEEIDKAYKGYEFGINMNTIKQSQTMFARRVFEMLASNTIVLSNYSRGVRLLFGDLVVCSDNADELERQLNRILEDDLKRKKFKLQGLRSVLSQHTYEHRLKYILEKLKIESESVSIGTQALVLAKCETEEEINSILSNYSRQKYYDKKLVILTEIIKDTAGEVHCVSDIKALEQFINEEDFSYITLFASNDYYGEYYLSDLICSYSYLKYYDCGKLPVTKDSYYEQVNGLDYQAGSEYKFVDKFVFSKSLCTKEYFIGLLDSQKLIDILKFKNINNKAFSIDCFSYIKNGLLADQQNISEICEDLILDSGVDLDKHLLPIAESIKLISPVEPKDILVKIDQAVIQKTLRKEIQVRDEDNRIKLNSNLDAKLHRLVAITDDIGLQDWNKIDISINNIDFKGDVLCVFEFLDKDKKQISHSTFVPNSSIGLEIPKEAVYGKMHIRVKGIAEVSIDKQILVKLSKNNNIENETYDSSDICIFNKNDMDAYLVRPKSKQILIKNGREGLEIRSTLDEDKHAYIYFNKVFTREEINLSLNSTFETIGTVSDFDFRTVFIFLDQNQEKLAHSIIKVDNFSHAMAIPENCKYVRIGFKVTGAGSVLLQTLKIGELRAKVNNFIGKSDTLVLAKQYPAYDDLYKYGFLHSRLRAYKNAGHLVDMFKFSGANGTFGFNEFESIDVFSGDAENLRSALKSGQFKKVLVHILDKNMWSILEEFISDLDITIWVHGSEAQVWQRRAYEFQGMADSEIFRRKKLSDQRRKFWQELINKKFSNVTLVFVSEYFKNEFVQDICDGKEDFNYEIIHNYIDKNLFPYQEKNVQDVYRILSIRPFSSLTYGNDLTVKAILELSKRPNFDKFIFTIVGDGPLFDETLSPIKHFKNVIIRREFLSQQQIAELHKEHGVFLVPTRMDTQGVSRGEAMSSGLVAVTTNVAAIPEFISKSEGGVVEAEDYEALAEFIYNLSKNNTTFQNYSIAGSKRVNQQCSHKNSIQKELGLING